MRGLYPFANSVLILDVADGELDAAEIDRERLSSRLKLDVLENTGKIHLFVAESVRSFVSLPLLHSHIRSLTFPNHPYYERRRARLW